MSLKSLRSLRDHVKSQKAANNTFERDFAIYPHWSLEFGASSIVRLLPDGNPNNPAPWVTKKTIPCVFPDPENESREVKLFVPCKEMYGPGTKCPALQPVRDLYKLEKSTRSSGNALEADRIKKIASKHWLDQQFFYNALIVKSGLVESDRPADLSPIRTLQISKQIQGVIETSLGLVDDENAPPSQFSDEELPCGTFSLEDVNRVLDGDVSDEELDSVLARFVGTPFVIVKKQKGDYANYESSYFLMRDKHELTPDDLQAIRTHGLTDLGAKYLPKQPTDEEYAIYKEIVEASIAGEEWDPRWEEAGIKYFRPKAKEGEEGAAGGSSSTGGARTNSIANRVRSNLGDAGEAGASSLSSAMNRRRTATASTETEASAKVEETVAEAPASEAPAAETPAATEGTAKKDPKALAAMIKAKIGNKG